MITFNNAVINLSPDGRSKLTATFQLNRGDFAMFVGFNGAGKTTLLDSIIGVRQCISGEITVNPARASIAYAVQDSASGLLPWKSILSNILLPALLTNKEEAEMRRKALTLLSEFGLTERSDDYPYRLSEGEKQIVNVLRCICTPAHVILLDEPFAALNFRAKIKAKELIADYSKDRTTVLVTHDPADCELPFNRFFLISNSVVSEVDAKSAADFLSNAISNP